jgi:hypothetical protein
MSAPRAVVVAALLALAPLCAAAQDVAEPRSGARFAAQVDGMSLLGAGVRTRTIANVKVYAIGLHVADEALKGPLAAFKGRTSTSDFHRQLVWGDFRKQLTLKFVRNVTKDQIQDAFREALVQSGTSGAHMEAFLGYFGDTSSGQDYVLRWEPGGVLKTTVAGQERPAITDKNFAAAVFAIWLGDKPIQDSIKKDLASRAEALLP